MPVHIAIHDTLPQKLRFLAVEFMHRSLQIAYNSLQMHVQHIVVDFCVVDKADLDLSDESSSASPLISFVLYEGCCNFIWGHCLLVASGTMRSTALI